MKKRIIIFILVISTFMILVGCSGRNQTLIIDENIQSDKDKSQIEDKTHEKDKTEVVEETIYTINLLAAGDIMFHSPQFRSAYNSTDKSYDFFPMFKYIKDYAEKADIAIANFETVTAGSDIEYSGFPRFNTPKESLIAIKEAGFDILSTSNNHSLDQGKKGLVNTIKAIEEYKMKNIGTYVEKEKPVLVEEVNGIKLAFLSYTYGLNGMDSTLSPEELSYMVNKIDEEKIKTDIEKSKTLGVDLTVVYIHWGHEYHREPSEYQLELGEKMVNWGANIILGSHPHVIQKSQIINLDGRDNFIIYSMGNFLSNQRKSSMGNSYTEDGIMVNFQIEKSSLTGETNIKNVEYIPTWVYRYRKEGKLKYEILPIEDVLSDTLDIEIESEIKNRIKKSYEDTMSKMNE